MTPRALLAVGVIGITCIPLYVFGGKFLPENIIQPLIMSIAAPIGILGFHPKHNGLKTEQFVANFFRQNFTKQERFYSELPVFWYNREEIIADILAEEKVKYIELKPTKKRGKQNVKKTQ